MEQLNVSNNAKTNTKKIDSLNFSKPKSTQIFLEWQSFARPFKKRSKEFYTT